ncbi:DNA-processing protein DprA [Anaerospora sp.]|uniref:DNA-processing protein DprA n=1 Tax=Anaerospora sp. TaxID=1960278 RepID=UPI002897E91D|nr:DNA-processing protein DprA [Anaerospora sp.]
MKNIHLAALHMVPGVGHARIKSLVAYFGDAEQAWLASKDDLRLSGCLDEMLCNKIVICREKIDVSKLLENWERKGIRIVSLGEAEYPALLANTYNPPAVLYYRGTLPVSDKLISIVGSRRATAYGRNVCKMLASQLAAAGIGVVSGAARGIDSAAHSGALEEGYTIAVLGNGVDICYPPENARLFEQIVEKGSLLSEYPPGTNPQPKLFPARNRIINGLSRGVLVVEAAERSGSLITADFALEEGRDVFAVPGSILSKTSKGTHYLIKQGAKLVDCAADILDEYGWGGFQRECKPQLLSTEEQSVYHVLQADNPVGIDEIVSQTQLPVPTVTHILLQLELQDLAIGYGGQRYMRTAREGTR